MKGSEIIYFLILATACLVVLLFLWFIFKKRKRLLVVFTFLLVLFYTSFYFLYPTIKVNIHAKRYEQLTEYLTKKYPNRTFTVVPKDYEEGYTVGEFHVNDVNTPRIGVTLRVNNRSDILQTSSWLKERGHYEQTKLYQDVMYHSFTDYTLDDTLPVVEKIDEWIKDELIVLALKIDHALGIAIFENKDGIISLLELQKVEKEDYVYVTFADYLFIYVDEHHDQDSLTITIKGHEEYKLNLDEIKNQLIVEKRF